MNINVPCNELVRCLSCIRLNIAEDLLKVRCVDFTCVTHVIVVGRVLVRGDTTGIADGSRILAHFGLGHWRSVSAQVSGFHGCRGLLDRSRMEGKKLVSISRDLTVRRRLSAKTVFLPGRDRRRSPSHSPP